MSTSHSGSSAPIEGSSVYQSTDKSWQADVLNVGKSQSEVPLWRLACDWAGGSPTLRGGCGGGYKTASFDPLEAIHLLYSYRVSEDPEAGEEQKLYFQDRSMPRSPSLLDGRSSALYKEKKLAASAKQNLITPAPRCGSRRFWARQGAQIVVSRSRFLQDGRA